MLIDGVFGCQSRLSTNSTSCGVGERIYLLQEGRPALRYNLKKRIYDVISCLWMILTHHASGLISLLRAEENSKDRAAAARHRRTLRSGCKQRRAELRDFRISRHRRRRQIVLEHRGSDCSRGNGVQMLRWRGAAPLFGRERAEDL